MFGWYIQIKVSTNHKHRILAKDVAFHIPADFWENDEYDDFQPPIGFREPAPATHREQRDIEEAKRLSLGVHHKPQTGESCSSAYVRAIHPIALSTVPTTSEQDNEFKVQTKATKGFIHRQLQEIVNFRRLSRRFRSTFESHVRDSIREKHRIRKTSTSEYYHLAGFKCAAIKRAKHDQNNMDARRLLSNTPSQG